MSINSKHLHFQQSGFAMLEVLISIFVLTIGLLGLAGLQLTNAQHNHSAQLRSQATIFAYDMLDRVRANPVAFNAGTYNLPTAAVQANCLNTTGCTPALMAGNDMYEWSAAAYNSSISNILPNGQTVICIDSTSNDGADAANHACDGLGTIYAVKIWWEDHRTGALQQFVTTTEF